jgi:hypothetical protein
VYRSPARFGRSPGRRVAMSCRFNPWSSLGPVPIIRSLPKSMGRLSSSNIDTCGSGADARRRWHGYDMKWFRRFGTSSMTANSSSSTPPFSLEPSARKLAICSRRTISTWARPTWRRPASCTWRPLPRRSAKCIASAPPSGRRSRRPAAISPSSGWWSRRWRSTTPMPTCGFRRNW